MNYSGLAALSQIETIYQKITSTNAHRNNINISNISAGGTRTSPGLGCPRPSCDNLGMKTARLLAAFVAATVFTACGSVSDPSNYVTKDFSGTLQPNGQVSETFTVGRAGEMQITLNQMSPPPRTGFVSISVGLLSGNACLPLQGYVIYPAPINQQRSFPRINPATYCIVINDTFGVVTEPTAFNIRYLHP